VVSDFDHTVSEYDAATGRVIRTIVFTPTPPPPGARFLTPGGVTVDSSGDAWVTVQRF
jgi:DNA-binding beta-propeller fold protein YncE